MARFICPTCARSFKNSVHLRVHSASHARDVAVQQQPTVTAYGTGDDSDQEELCVICYDRRADAVLHPCAHQNICRSCASQLITCPLCRCNIESVGRQFLPNANEQTDEADGPPRPPVLSHLDSAFEIANAIEEWRKKAAAWEQLQQQTKADVANYSSEVEKYWKKYNEEMAEYSEKTVEYLQEWQSNLNSWWQSAALQEYQPRWFRLWDEASQSYYYYEENTGESQWDEPAAWVEHVEESGGEYEMAPALHAVWTLQKAFRRHRRRNQNR
jgi:hypothetical protein